MDAADDLRQGPARTAPKTTFVTSDHHFGHLNIIKYCNRPFRDVAEMDRVLTENWNKVVGPGDLVWYLGDFSLAKPAQIAKYLQRLNGTKYLVKGNHDRGDEAMMKAGFEDVLRAFVLRTRIGYIHMSHEPLEPSQEAAAMKGMKYAFCGHVHDAWRIKQLSWAKTINVGVDVNGYAPVELETFVKELES